jgi:hypothetical protein
LDDLLESWLEAIDKEDINESERLAKFILANLDQLVEDHRNNIKRMAEETLNQIKQQRDKEKLIEEIMKPK